MAHQDKVIEVDVLVIGGGLAGTWAALSAKNFVDDVVLVDKSRVARSGASTSAAGVMLCPTEDDDLEAWRQEIVERGDYLNDQEWVDIMLREQVSRIKEMEEWGTAFERDDKGKIQRLAGRGHQITRLLMFDGKKLMEKMREKVLEKKVILAERIAITDLLTSDGQHPTKGRVVGAIGFDYRSGEFKVFKAKAVVVATGAIHPKRGVHYIDNVTGDGVALAFRAGAALIGMEFVIGGFMGLWNRRFKTCGFNMFAGHGVRWLNARGERFMPKYDPVLAERANMQGLVMAWLKEVTEGRGPIYADITNMTPETVERFRRVLPHVMKIMDRAGIDLAKDKLEITLHGGVYGAQGDGGININTYCEAAVPGLYACGSTTKHRVHGTYSVGGVNLAYCVVSGHRAGEYASKYAKAFGQGKIIDGQVSNLKGVALAPLQLEGGLNVDKVWEDIREVTVPMEFSYIKSESRLRKTLSEIGRIKTSLLQIGASDYHELVKVNELKNYVQCCELAYTAALERKESRYFHFREDYPNTDNKDWLKWVVLRQENGKIAISFEPIPVYRYPVQPEAFESKPAPIQLSLPRERR